MHGVAALGRWTEITSYYTCVKTDGQGRWVTAACRYCKWEQSANITRMKRHWQDMHKPVPSQSRSDSTSSITPSSAGTLSITPSSAGTVTSCVPSSSNTDSQCSQVMVQSRKRQRSVLEWTDATFAPDRQQRSEELLASLQVGASLPYSVLAGPDMAAFCRSLHSEFKLPSRDALQQLVKNLYVSTKDAVLKLLTDCTVVLGVDGWEDCQHFHVLGITAQVLKFGSPAFLIYSERQCERQTGEVISAGIQQAIDMLATVNSTPCAVCSDNATSMKSAVGRLPNVE